MDKEAYGEMPCKTADEEITFFAQLATQYFTKTKLKKSAEKDPVLIFENNCGDKSWVLQFMPRFDKERICSAVAIISYVKGLHGSNYYEVHLKDYAGLEEYGLEIYHKIKLAEFEARTKCLDPSKKIY